MGEDKALLDAGGQSFLERVVRTLAVHCDPVLVVVREERADLADVARAAGATVLFNPDPTPGPIASVRIALEHLAADPDCQGMVLLPVDHPAVRPETIEAICAAFSAAGAADGTIAGQTRDVSVQVDGEDRGPGREGIADSGHPSARIVVPVLNGRTGHPPLFGATVFAELQAPDLAGGARTVLHADPSRVLRLDVDDFGVTLDIDTPDDWRAAIQNGLLPAPISHSAIGDPATAGSTGLERGTGIR